MPWQACTDPCFETTCGAVCMQPVQLRRSSAELGSHSMHWCHHGVTSHSQTCTTLYMCDTQLMRGGAGGASVSSDAQQKRSSDTE